MSYSKDYKELQSHIEEQLSARHDYCTRNLLMAIRDLTDDFEYADKFRSLYPSIDQNLRDELCGRLHRALAYQNVDYDPQLENITEEEYELHVERIQEIKDTYFQGNDHSARKIFFEAVTSVFILKAFLSMNWLLLGYGMLSGVKSVDEKIRGFNNSVASKLNVFADHYLIRQLPFSLHYKDLWKYVDTKLSVGQSRHRELLVIIKKLTQDLENNHNKKSLFHADVNAVVTHELCGKLHQILAHLDPSYDDNLEPISLEDYANHVRRIIEIRDTHFIGKDWSRVQKGLESIGAILVLAGLLMTIGVFPVIWASASLYMLSGILFMAGSQVAGAQGFSHLMASKLTLFVDKSAEVQLQPYDTAISLSV